MSTVHPLWLAAEPVEAVFDLRELLEDEGVTSTSIAGADPAGRLGPDQLRSRLRWSS